MEDKIFVKLKDTGGIFNLPQQDVAITGKVAYKVTLDSAVKNAIKRGILVECDEDANVPDKKPVAPVTDEALVAELEAVKAELEATKVALAEAGKVTDEALVAELEAVKAELAAEQKKVANLQATLEKKEKATTK